MTNITQQILLVDDFPDNRVTYRRYLQRNKPNAYRILESNTGEEALLCCQQQFPDVILLNYRLPDMNGLEFLNRLKTQSGRTHLPIIMIQGNVEIAVQAMKKGAVEYLLKKNITPESLNLAIERVIETQPALSACQQAQETLQIYAAELEELYHHAPCGYHSLDTDGIFIRINDTELNMLGYSAEEIVGKKKFSDLLTPESLPVFQENFPRFKQRGWVRDLEFEMLRKNGTILSLNQASGKGNCQN
jgi:PAS domain S-box-containing protein